MSDTRDFKDRLLDFSQLTFEVRKTMRYDDVGDYFDNKIISYDFEDPVINNAIAIHEFVEYTLIKSAGIEPSLIDKFDTDDTYPDKYPTEYSLYGKFHEMANMIERQFVENLGLDWDTHEQIINTAEVQVAVRNITEELHKAKPDTEEMEESRKVVEEAFDEKT